MKTGRRVNVGPFYFAPRAGFEPATNRLTVDRSTAELPRNALVCAQYIRTRPF